MYVDQLLLLESFSVTLSYFCQLTVMICIFVHKTTVQKIAIQICKPSPIPGRHFLAIFQGKL